MARATWNGTVIAEIEPTDAFELVEGNVYFPPMRQASTSGRARRTRSAGGRAPPATTTSWWTARSTRRGLVLPAPRTRQAHQGPRRLLEGRDGRALISPMKFGLQINNFTWRGVRRPTESGVSRRSWPPKRRSIVGCGDVRAPPLASLGDDRLPVEAPRRTWPARCSRCSVRIQPAE